ncbi:hypothetical protein BJ165DRAFT_1401291 [Panaeolus papilionaceus]|nr:hypothetical protein BJ165DRAFT_1401291 [Panaeolus papilionaceus]
MHFTNIVAFVATASTLFLGVSARGDFSRSCTNYYIQGNNILRARCGNGSGGQVESALDLNACIGISSGPGANLDCRPNGNYAAQGCTNCLIRTGAYMRCMCPGMERIADLDACVANQRGLLTCSFN